MGMRTHRRPAEDASCHHQLLRETNAICFMMMAPFALSEVETLVRDYSTVQCGCNGAGDTFRCRYTRRDTLELGEVVDDEVEAGGKDAGAELAGVVVDELPVRAAIR